MTAPSEEGKLFPCPFCGSGNITVAHRDSPLYPFTVGCGGVDCGAEIILRAKNDAIAAWNRRAA